MKQQYPQVTYQGFQTTDGWEVVVRRVGQPARLMDQPQQAEQLVLNLLTDYLGDKARAESLQADFAAVTNGRFAGDWSLTAEEVETILAEVEVLRARWRRALLRG